MNVAFFNVLLVPVLDRLMFSVLIRDALVSGPVVGVGGFSIASGVLPNEAVQALPVGSPHDLKADIAVALHRADHNGLVPLVATSLAFHPTTNKGLINLYDALQQLGIYLVKSPAYAMGEVPSSLVCNTYHALELVGRDSL